MDNPMECSICQEDFDEGRRCPRILPCSHHFCAQCIDQMLAKKMKQCPVCRMGFRAKVSTDLMINRGVLDFMRHVAQQKSDIKGKSSPHSRIKGKSSSSSTEKGLRKEGVNVTSRINEGASTSGRIEGERSSSSRRNGECSSSRRSGEHSSSGKRKRESSSSSRRGESSSANENNRESSSNIRRKGNSSRPPQQKRPRSSSHTTNAYGAIYYDGNAWDGFDEDEWTNQDVDDLDLVREEFEDFEEEWKQDAYGHYGDDVSGILNRLDKEGDDWEWSENGDDWEDEDNCEIHDADDDWDHEDFEEYYSEVWESGYCDYDGDLLID